MLEPETMIENETNTPSANVSPSAPTSHQTIPVNISAMNTEIDPTTGLPMLKGVHFADFDISASLKSRLAAGGFATPTPVQAKAIPPALEGHDILATASTGTGKTLSFPHPDDRADGGELRAFGREASAGRSAALILLPTRELAMQVLEAYAKINPQAKSDSVLVCGGLSENTQLDQLERGPRLVVATPGRLEDFLRRRSVNLGSVEMLVLDEVDRMLDMGFLPAIRRIVGALPKARQTMCYSATLDANITEIVRDYVQKPVRIEIGTTSKPSDRVELIVYTVMQDQKLGLLNQMLNEEEGTFLVFSPDQAWRGPHCEEAGEAGPRHGGDPWGSLAEPAEGGAEGLCDRTAPHPGGDGRGGSGHRREGYCPCGELRPAGRERRTSCTGLDVRDARARTALRRRL